MIKIIPAVPTRTPMPILENFLFEIKDGLLTIAATDMEIALKSSINIVADENKSMVIPAKLLYDTVRALKDTTIYFDVQNSGKIILKTDNGKYTISYLPTTDFPQLPSFPLDSTEQDINEITINGEDLRWAIEKTSFAVSKEEMRPAMTGILFEFGEEGMRFVATDGHRLVNLLKKNINPNLNEQYIIPERAVSALQKVLDEKDVKILLSKTHVSFILSDIELITRVIGYKYPDYASVIPLENEFELKVNTKETSRS